MNKQDKIETIEINGEKFCKLGDISKPADTVDGLEYCVIRTYSAGVHIGYVKSLVGQQCELVNSRRLWSWQGASSLSQAAMEGCKSNKFAMTLPKLILTDVIEMIPCTEKAKAVLDAISEWKE